MNVATASEVQPLTDEQVTDYLRRIGLERGAAPAPGLRELQLQHLLTVPFENLSIHLGEPYSLAIDDLFDKIVRRRRGGFCYELNGLFAALLTSLDYQVDLLGGGVYGPNGLGPPFDHLALAVQGQLVDVGFGRLSAYPLRLDSESPQADPCGPLRVERHDNGDLEVSRDGAPQYRLEARPRNLADFAPTCWWQHTRPGSHFRTRPLCSRLTDTFGVITIADRQLISTEGGHREQTDLASDEDVLRAYREQFGVELDRLPVTVSD